MRAVVPSLQFAAILTPLIVVFLLCARRVAPRISRVDALLMSKVGIALAFAFSTFVTVGYIPAFVGVPLAVAFGIASVLGLAVFILRAGS